VFTHAGIRLHAHQNDVEIWNFASVLELRRAACCIFHVVKLADFAV